IQMLRFLYFYDRFNRFERIEISFSQFVLMLESIAVITRFRQILIDAVGDQFISIRYTFISPIILFFLTLDIAIDTIGIEQLLVYCGISVSLEQILQRMLIQRGSIKDFLKYRGYAIFCRLRILEISGKPIFNNGLTFYTFCQI